MLRVGVALIAISLFMAGAGAVVPMLGLLIAAFAPDAFLVGLALVVFSLIRRRTKHVAVAAAATVLITGLLAVNTRLPSIVSDSMNPNALTIARHLIGAVGQPLHVETNTAELRGRRFPYASVVPACRGDGCFITSGFHGPYPGILRDYWRENVVNTALAAGFSKAAAGEVAPRVVVSAMREGDLLSVTMEMTDANGASLARFSGRFRNGYPVETSDDASEGNPDWLGGALQYLLHGNSVTRWLSRWARPATEPPLKGFLKAAASLSDPQPRNPRPSLSRS
jgi:hypothetical protein